MKRFSKLVYALSVSGTLLSACASLTVPEKPSPESSLAIAAEIPEVFFNADGVSLPFETSWWEAFGDPDLTRLVNAALAENRALEVAQANVRIASMRLERQERERGIQTSSSANLEAGRAAFPNRSVIATASGNLGASWEYDAFGRIASAIRAAAFTVEAEEQARRDIAVIISSETALAYIDLRGAQRRLAVARDNAQTQLQSLDLLKLRLENGRATDLDVSRSEAQYRTTLADLPRFQAGIESAVSRLAVLTGTSASAPSQDLLDLKETERDIPSLTESFTVNAPQTLLRRRPDIRLAETEISRRLALSDVERARLFPTLIFNADIFSLFGNGNRFDQASSLGFGLGPALRWEGPDLTRVRADIAVADAETERAYIVYEQTVLQALADVEAALSNRRNEATRQENLILAVRSAKQSLELAQLRFEEGVDDFLDVLDAQRTLLAAEDRLAENRLQTTRLTVQTYRELGGIW